MPTHCLGTIVLALPYFFRYSGETLRNLVKIQSCAATVTVTNRSPICKETLYNQSIPTSIGLAPIVLLSTPASLVAPLRRSMLSRQEKNPPTSQFEQWDATDYIALMANPAFRTEEALRTLFAANFFAFAAEYTRGELISNFTMNVDPQKGLLGMSSSYNEGMEGMGEHFETKIAGQKKQTARAEAETNNIDKLNEWSKTAPVDSFFVWNSPPGKISEGYAGLNSHSFIFIYHKTTANTVVLHQLRTWMSLSQHAEFQNQISSHTQNISSAVNAVEHSYRIINNISVFEPKDVGCTSAAEVVAKLTESAYQTEQTWKTKPQEMPKVPDAEYAQLRDFLLSLYVRVVVPALLTEVPETQDANSTEWLAFISSPAYKMLIQKLDVAFGILAYQPLTKWVAEKDENKQQSLLGQLLRKKDTSITTLSFEEIEEKLLSLFHLQLQKSAGTPITRKQIKEYNAIASSLMATTSRGLSLGQCGLGTFIPTRMFKTFGLQDIAGSTLNPGMLLGLPSHEKAAAFSFLTTKKYLPLHLPNGETWYVLAKHHQLYANYFAQNPNSFTADGLPIGPCGWLLRGDPRGMDELVLTGGEFSQFELLKASLLADLLSNPHDTLSLLESSLMPHIHSAVQKERLTQVLLTLHDALKTTVSLQELLFSDFFNKTAFPLIASLSKKVDVRQFVTNPEHTAAQVVAAFEV